MNTTKNWSNTEISELKDLYETATKEDLVNRFNTDWEKIKDKAAKLGGLNRQKCKINEIDLISDYKNNIPLKELWVKYNITNPTLIKIIKKYKVDKRNNTIDAIEVEQFKADYQILSMPKLVDKYNVSRPSIRAKAKQLNLTRPKLFTLKQPILLDKTKEICDAYTNDNKSMATLAKEYNVIPATIFNLLHNNNIKIKEGAYGAAEQEIRTWLKSTVGLDFPSNRMILCGKEIDMYNEELKIGIEYCGLHWHNEQSGKTTNYHYDKYKACLDKGIHLITIFEDEWLDRQEQVKGALLSILGKNDKKLFARKCEVKTIDKVTGNKFYQDYHIQGKCGLSYAFAGLYYNNELVGVMSFGRHHRDNNKNVLDRLCFKAGVSVAGGASKLFKFLLNETKITDLISWSDNRWFQGQVYEKLGFTKEIDMKPDYSYVNTNKNGVRLSKQSQKKGNTNCPADMTEKQWCTKRGLYRIWDCGKKRWVYDRSTV